MVSAIYVIKNITEGISDKDFAGVERMCDLSEYLDAGITIPADDLFQFSEGTLGIVDMALIEMYIFFFKEHIMK